MVILLSESIFHCIRPAHTLNPSRSCSCFHFNTGCLLIHELSNNFSFYFLKEDSLNHSFFTLAWCV